MPSGAKKRKAAKKRKEIQPNNNANPSPAPTQGGGDLKPQNDWHSDVGEASSTASQDASLHDILTDGEEEKIENSETVSTLPPAEGVKSEGNNEHDVLVESESKIEDGFVKTNGNFGHDETARKSYDGGSSGSSGCNSGSTSDDESHGIKRSQPVSTITIGEASHAVGVSELSKDAASQQEKATIPSVGKITATHDDEADAGKDSGVSEPLLVPPPHPVEKTSWKGCCGLLELFTGSGR